MDKSTLLFVRPPQAAGLDLSFLEQRWRLRVSTPEPSLAMGDAAVGLVWLPVEDADGRLEALLCRGDAPAWVALVAGDTALARQRASLIQRYCHDYHTLPLDPGRLAVVLGHAEGMARLATPAAAATGAGRLVGDSAPMRRLSRQLRKVAAVEAPVLIQGESGTGKEFAAQAVHEHSRRGDGPFIAINCGALPGSLIQSELFGHEKGAFTGAQQRKIGRIEAAHGGTVFLDEIGDLALDLQANLLRFLQEGTVERVGGHASLRVDVRVIAASHVNLEAAVAEGQFRADLFYRLNVLRLDMPPLRERGSDVERLAQHYYQRFLPEKAAAVRGFSGEALQAMRAHDWPGNVRELVNRVRRAMVMCEGRWIAPADLGLLPAPESVPTLADVRTRAESAAVEAALLHSGHNVTRAAARLGVSRVTLYRLMEKHRLLAALPLAASDDS